tara:strand:- start:509 stop:1999 length:1491 start_codon:yes stop_codon:yes gene_type:complete
MQNILEIDGISKSFSDIQANNDISLYLRQGQIHALLGENGAGKSTLVKIIYGIVKPDHGTMTLNGKPYDPDTPEVARNEGIGMVFQHFSLFESLSVLDNIILGQKENLKKDKILERLDYLQNEYDLFIDINKIVATLSAGEKQKVEIIRCMLQDPKIMILDEPTSVLNPSEVEKLFSFLRKLSDQGMAVLYISHKLHEIKELCDTSTILRGGKVVKSCDTASITIEDLAQLMVGKAIDNKVKLSEPKQARVLDIKNISYTNPDIYGVSLKGIKFSVNFGEIFGIAGISGNGQTELMKILSGEVGTSDGNQILYHDEDISNLGINERRKREIVFVPEDRLGHSAVGGLSLSENLLLTNLWDLKFFSKGVIDSNYVNEKTVEVIKKFNVQCNDAASLASSLSGGNLQKFVVGREIIKMPKLVVCEQPTWGVDVGSASLIHNFLIEISNTGSAILIISQDLDELRSICHRIAIISNGVLSKPYDANRITPQDIALEMAK